MEVTFFTYLGVACATYAFVFKLLPWLEGEKR